MSQRRCRLTLTTSVCVVALLFLLGVFARASAAGEKRPMGGQKSSQEIGNDHGRTCLGVGQSW
jgi:hypothetical protein